MKHLLFIFFFSTLFLLTQNAKAQTELNEVVVIGTRSSKKTPVAQTNIESEEIQQRNIRMDIPQLIELTPSVVLSTESGIGTGNTSFRIRGTDPTRTNITLDGVPLNRAEAQVVFWVNLPGLTTSINSIQIQRGVGSSSNGPGAFGATVSLQTPLPSADPKVELSSTVGSFNTFENTVRVSTGIIAKTLRFDAGYSNIRSDGYIERSWTKQESFYVCGAWTMGKTLIKGVILNGTQQTALAWNGVPGFAIDNFRFPKYVTGVGSYTPENNRKYNPGGEFLDDDENIAYYPDHSDNNKQTQYMMQFVQGIGSKWNLATVLYAIDGGGYFREYNTFNDSRDRISDRLERLDRLDRYGVYKTVESPIATRSLLWKSSDNVKDKILDEDLYGVISSLNYSSSKLQWTSGGAGNLYKGHHFGKIHWVRYGQGKMIDADWYSNHGTKQDYNVYSKLTWQMNKIIDLYADMQYRHIHYKMEGADVDGKMLDQEHFFNFLNPKAGLFFGFNSKNTAYASFSVANREPSRTDFKNAVKEGGNVFPNSERLYDTELGYNFKSSFLTLGANLYYMLYKDQLVVTGKINDVGYPIMENVNKSYRAGIELMGAINFTKSLRLEANMTLSRNKIDDLNIYIPYLDEQSFLKEYHYSQTDLPFSPNIVGSLQLQYYATKKLVLILNGKYVGEQYYDNTSSEDRQLNAYYVGNFQTNYSFKLAGLNLSCGLLINNILNKEYITSAWVTRDIHSDGRFYIENGFFPQAKRHALFKLSLLL